MKERKTEEKSQSSKEKLKRYFRKILGITAAIGLGYVGLKVIGRKLNAFIP